MGKVNTVFSLIHTTLHTLHSLHSMRFLNWHREWWEDCEGVLEARVRYVEPAAFTKWSALGVEEQRVNVVIDLVSTGDPWTDGPDEQPSAPITGRLGDGYRVDADIEIWSSDDALTVPVSAVFREAGEWFVFAVVRDTAEKRSVSLGRRSSEAAEVLSGLQAGDVVIRYPTADIAPGGKGSYNLVTGSVRTSVDDLTTTK
jgi:hypothetical protein